MHRPRSKNTRTLFIRTPGPPFRRPFSTHSRSASRQYLHGRSSPHFLLFCLHASQRSLPDLGSGSACTQSTPLVVHRVQGRCLSHYTDHQRHTSKSRRRKTYFFVVLSTSFARGFDSVCRGFGEWCGALCWAAVPRLGIWRGR